LRPYIYTHTMQKLLSVALAIFALISTGNAQTALPTSWNFSTPAVTSPPNGWTFGIGLNGTGGLTYSGNSAIGDNVSARLDATGEFVKIWFADKPGPVSYYIKGTGISPGPTFTGTFNVQESIDDVTYTDLKVFTTASPIPGGTMGIANKFVHTPAASSRYIRFFFTEKQSGTNVALDSILIKAAPAGTNAAINVRVGQNTVVNQTTHTIGTTATSTFNIQNIGTAQVLNIDSIRLSGDAAGDYSLANIPTSIDALSNQNFNVNFNSSTNGSRKATLKIYNNDPEKNPYTIQLYGIGGTLATEPQSSPASVIASNISSFGFKVAITPPATAPEGYILLRKRGSTITDIPVDGIKYKIGDLIGSSVVAYVGDSVITNLKPKYIFAESEYQLKAFSFNGPPSFENYLTSSSTDASITTLGKQPGNYYNGIDPNISSFILDLRDKINKHDTIFYGAYAPRLVLGYLARDTSAGRQVVNCVYTNIPYIFEGGFNWASSQGGNATLTREHTFAQSWMPSSNNSSPNWEVLPGGKERPEFNDMHNLFPTHQNNANARRSNNPFGNVVNATYTAPTGFGKLGTNSTGQTVYEPKDDHKGEVARALMYMSVCYHKKDNPNHIWAFPSTQSPAVLLQWHQQDPPSPLEIARHEYIFGLQKNRNPFIDNPEWALSINFANMTFLPTSVEKLTFDHSILTFPNPAKDRLFVDATLIYSKGMRYEILNTAGASVDKGTLFDAQSNISMPSKSGVYLLKLSSEKGTFVTKILKD
jgi:hypothetical protein